MQISVILLCYIDKYALQIRHKNEIVRIEFNFKMQDLWVKSNLNKWYSDVDTMTFANALNAFGKLVPHYIPLIKPQESDLTEAEVRYILNLPKDLYNISPDEWIATL